MKQLEKLMLVGLGIILTSFLILSNANAQDTAVRPFVITIKSTADYIKLEKAVDHLATQLYRLNQLYPGFGYHHHYNEAGELLSVTIEGVDDNLLANKVAKCIMRLESLGTLSREVELQYLPKLKPTENVKSMNETEALNYRPEGALLGTDDLIIILDLPVL